MSVRRALVDCTVLCLQDSCVFYPSCRGCLARIDVEQQNTARCRCSRCGYWCLRGQVGYRYRLSLRVTRDRSIFGITVFGSTLNPFFGIDATLLHRLVQNTDGPVEPSVHISLLLKAVEDCFIGRHFIFGIKLTENENGPWIDNPVSNGSHSKDVQFIASQMILPKASSLSGCSVVTYYESLLQKASGNGQRFADLSRTSMFPATSLLLTPQPSPASSSKATLSTFSLLLQSSQRSQHSECSLNPTPPWQQSPGVVTSSAEQDEGCGDESSRQTDNSGTPHLAQRVGLEKHKVTEKRTPLLPMDPRFSGHPTFVKYTNSSIIDSVGNSSILNSWFTPSRADLRRIEHAVGSIGKLTSALPSSSVAWENLPLSESLTEFICEQNKELDVVCEAKPNLSAHSKKEATPKKGEITNLITDASSAGHRTAQLEKSHSLGAIHTPIPNECDRQYLSNQTCKDTCSPRFNLQYNETLYIEKEAKGCERDSYNCSADLFNHSLMNDTSTEMLNEQTQTVMTTSLKSDQNHPRKGNIDGTHSSLENQRQKSGLYSARNSLTLQDFNFIPPSQSTPIVKVSVGLQSSNSYRKDSGALRGNLRELNHKLPANATSVLSKANGPSADHLLQCGRECTKENLTWSTTPTRCIHKPSAGRRLWKPDKHQSPVPAHQHLRVQRRKRNLQITGVSSHNRDSGVTVCDIDNSEILVPPIPAAKTQASHQRTRQIESCSSNLPFSRKEQEREEADCQILINPSHSRARPADNWDIEIAEDRSLSRSNDCLLVDESRMCDWSKDLFSDSV